MCIDITFDPMKDAMKLIQHGVSLELAREIKWDNGFCWVDERRDYGEVREVGLALIHGRLFYVVFTRRDATRRIISLRRANQREEEKRYGINTRSFHSLHTGGRSGDPAMDRTRPGYDRPFRRESGISTVLSSSRPIDGG